MRDSVAFPEPNHTQTPNKFFEMISNMGDAELRVTLIMIRHTFGWHENNFKMGISKLAKASGLSRQGALTGAMEAEKRGTFRRTNPSKKTEAEWELITVNSMVDDDQHLNLVEVVSPQHLNQVEVEPLPGRGQVGVKERLNKRGKKGDLVDGILAFSKSQVGDGRIETVIYETFAISPNWHRVEGRDFLQWASGISEFEIKLAIWAKWWEATWPGNTGAPPTLAKIRELWPQAFKERRVQQEVFAEVH